MVYHGKSESKMDENWRYPYDLGNLQMENVNPIGGTPIYGNPQLVLNIIVEKGKWRFPKMVVPTNGWFLLGKSQSNMDDDWGTSMT